MGALFYMGTTQPNTLTIDKASLSKFNCRVRLQALNYACLLVNFSSLAAYGWAESKPAFPAMMKCFRVTTLTTLGSELKQQVLSLSNLRSILDLPCGHGRVARHLRVRFPGSQLICCDINRDGVDFCQSSYAATGMYSNAELDVHFDHYESFTLFNFNKLL